MSVEPFKVGDKVYRVDWSVTSQDDQRATVRDFLVVAVTPRGCWIDVYGERAWVSHSSRQYARTHAGAVEQAKRRATSYLKLSRADVARAEERLRVLGGEVPSQRFRLDLRLSR